MGKNDFSPSDLVLRTRWYIRLRFFLLAVLTVSGFVPLLIANGWSAEVVRDFWFCAGIIGSCVIYYFLGQQKRSDIYFDRLAISLFAIDILIITYFIYTKGGIESRSVILYIMPILMSAAIFGRRAVYFTAIGSAVAYDALILANYFGFFRSLETVTNQATDLTYVIDTVAFFTVVLLLMGFLADYITSLLVTKERQARESAEALKRAQAVAKLGSWEWDILQDKITWSEGLFKLFGVKEGSVKTDYETYLSLLHPDDRKVAANAVGRALKTCKPFVFDHRIIRPDKSITLIHAEGQVITDKRGRPIKMYGTGRDVTHERSLEQAKGDFVSLASHQLRTPATSVKVLLSLLREGYMGDLPPRQKELLQQAYDANERQLQIANDLLNIARLEAGRLILSKREIDARQWLKEALADLRPVVRKNKHKLRSVMPREQVTLVADPNRLHMVLDNLLSNASKYTAPGGVITVSLTSTRTAVQISVTDTGIGIAKDELPKLFHKFMRIDNRLSTEVEGSGLGLYLAKSIVDLHKGTIKVRSRLGRGTSFIITLPKKPARHI